MFTRRVAWIVLLVVSVVFAAADGPDVQPPVPKQSLAAKPPMGWSSWNAFGCAIDETTVRQMADALISSGMAAAGYRYVNVDDCWMAAHRDPAGRLAADPKRFPSGMAALGTYLHRHGLKFGLYLSAGTGTCQNLPGSLDHEPLDAATLAAWGIDLLKYDNCHAGSRSASERFRAMGQALTATGRNIVYSICEWGDNQPWHWASRAGAHYWRTAGDIEDTWESTIAITRRQIGLQRFSGPNAWNDLDSLEVGNGGMSTEEYRAQISIWAVLNAPLIASNDLRSMTPVTRSLLANPGIIAIDQDWAGVQGRKVDERGTVQVWVKPMSAGGAAVAILNSGTSEAMTGVTAAELGLSQTATLEARDVWDGGASSTHTKGIRASVPAHGVRMLLVTARPQDS
jgi:alpha-galactosidase